MTDDDASARRHRFSLANGRAVAKMLRRYDEERAVLYRQHIRATVEYASPILIDAIASAGVTLAGLVDRMMPPADWPNVIVGQTGGQAPFGLDGVLTNVRRSPLRDRAFEWRFARHGAVIRPLSDPAGALAVRVSGDTLDAVIDIGDVRMVLEADWGRLRLAQPVPSTILLGTVGSELSGLVDHPLLRRTGCIVRSVTLPDAGQLPVIGFDCGLQPIDLLGPDEEDVG